MAPTKKAEEAMGKGPKWRRPLVLAHRGSLKKAPENTMASFRKALEDGADGLELDIHLTTDGHIVVHHDATVDRTTDGKGYIGEKSLEAVKALDAGSWFSAAFTGERVPLLSEVFKLCFSWPGGGKHVLIEMKGPCHGVPGAAQKLSSLSGIILPPNYAELPRKLVEELAPYKEEVRKGLVEAEAFTLPYLRELQTLLPELKVYYLSCGVWGNLGLLEKEDLEGKDLGLSGVSVLHKSLSRASALRLRERQRSIYVWTSDGTKSLKASVEVHGVHGLITNTPEEAMQVVDEADAKFREGVAFPAAEASLLGPSAALAGVSVAAAGLVASSGFSLSTDALFLGCIAAVSCLSLLCCFAFVQKKRQKVKQHQHSD